MRPRSILSWINMALGLWLVAGPFLMLSVITPLALGVHIGVGVIIAGLAVACATTDVDGLPYAFVPLGLFAGTMPFIFHYLGPGAVALQVTDYVTGVLVITIGVVAEILHTRERKAEALPEEERVRRAA